MNFSLRPVEAADEPFLVQLYALTRAAELALVPWDAAQREAFVRSQFALQTGFYQEKYADAVHSVVLCDGVAMGRLYVHRRAKEIRILDLTLQVHAQAEAVSEQLVASLMDEAASARLPLNIHLEPFNALQPLFERLGFIKVSDNGAHALYEWQAV
jgi:predicted GNAT family N-acyltransferase